MTNMKLTQLWQHYQSDNLFNYASVRPFLEEYGEMVQFSKGRQLIEQGGYPEFVYFIVKGLVVGKKIYRDGNEFTYFLADNKAGNIGLLEVLAHQVHYAAAVECLTDVTLVKVPAPLIYQKIMEDPVLLRECVALLANDLYEVSNKEGRFYRLRGIDRARIYFVEYYENNRSDEDRVAVDKKQREFSAELGISIRTVDRVIKELTKTKEIQYVNRKVMITATNYQRMMANLTNKGVS